MARTLAPWRWPLHWQILLGLLIGALIGWWLGAWGVGQLPAGTDEAKAGAAAGGIVRASIPFIVLKLIGDLFLNGLKLIVVPLVVSSIVLAVANMSSGRDFGRLGIKTLGYYLATSTIAILIGLTLVNIVRPGVGSDGMGLLQGRDLSAFEQETAAVDRMTGDRGATDFLDTFRQMVPPNLFEAAATNQLLGLIVVSLLVGFFLGRMRSDAKPLLLTFVRGVYELTLNITDVVLRFAPIGVIGLIAATVGEQYARLVPDGRFAEFAGKLVQFAGVAFAALMLHLLVVLPLILLLMARVKPSRHFRAMTPAMATAFSTSSSSATLPVTIDCVERRAGVSNRTASFVLPLGATVNMDGTALYECVAAVFICQAFGVELGFATQFFVVITALLTSIGVAGVPAASLVAIIVILTGVEQQLPEGALPAGVSLVTGLGLLFVFDRPLDMTRTVVNIFSDSVGAVVIAKSEGETEVLKGEAQHGAHGEHGVEEERESRSEVLRESP